MTIHGKKSAVPAWRTLRHEGGNPENPGAATVREQKLRYVCPVRQDGPAAIPVLGTGKPEYKALRAMLAPLRQSL